MWPRDMDGEGLQAGLQLAAGLQFLLQERPWPRERAKGNSPGAHWGIGVKGKPGRGSHACSGGALFTTHRHSATQTIKTRIILGGLCLL